MIDRRTRFAILALCTIVVGLLVHLRGDALGPVVRDVLGDALWAAMIASWIGVLASQAALMLRSAVAYAACVVVEVRQAYHAPALGAVRATRLGTSCWPAASTRRLVGGETTAV